MSNQLQISGGAKVRDLNDVIIGTSGVLSSLAFDVANGVPKLDANGKILVSQLPNSVMEYKGTWNANTNTPTLVNGTGNQGDVYLCTTAGTVNFGAGAIAFIVGDSAIYSGSIWQRSGGATGSVSSVGLSTTASAFTIGGSPVSTSGTISFNPNGNSGQYINGAGSLTTFPSLASYITLTSLSANSPLSYNNTTGVFSIAQSGAAADGYISSTDWNIFNNKLSTATAASTYVPYTGANASVDLGLFNLSSTSVLVTGTAGSGHIHFRNQSSTPNGLTNYMTMYSNAAGTAIGIINTGGNAALLSISSLSANRTFTFPNASGTLALTSDISYPVTSVFGRTGAVVATSGDYTTDQVTEGSTNLYFTNTRARAAISLTTTGTSGASTYNNTTGVLNIPNYADQYVGTVTSVAASAGTGISISGSPITTSGTLTITNTAPDQTVVLTASTGISVTGSYPSFTITNTSPSSGGTVTSVAALTLGTSGTDLSSTVATGTTTPVITLNVPTASAANRGALSSTDWTTFNNKQSALTNPVTGTGTTNYLPKFTGTSTIGNSQIFDNGTNVGIGTTTPSARLQVGDLANTSGVKNDIFITGDTVNTNGFYARLIFGNSSQSGGSTASIRGERSNGSNYATSLTFFTNGTASAGDGSERMRLDASGNLGLGVTPSAWVSSAKAIQIGNRTALWEASSITFLTNNTYTDGTDKYLTTAAASRYYQDAGNHIWNIAPSGTAGNAISFTQAMTLGTNSGLSVGTTTAAPANGLIVGGDVKIKNNTLYIGTSDTGDIFVSPSTGYMYYEYPTSYGAIFRSQSGTTSLTIAASTGAATFSSSVTAGDQIRITGTTANALYLYGAATIKPYITINEYGVRDWKIAAGQSASGTLSITATLGGTDGIIINGSGNVGIGTTSPAARLDVRVASESPATGAVGLIVGTSNGANDIFRWFDGATQLGVFKNNGSVGIGTTSPSYKLDVNGTGRFSGDVITTAGNITLYNSNAAYGLIDTANSNYSYYLQTYSSQFRIYNNATSTTVLNFLATGAATFSSSVTLARPASGATLLQLSGTSAYGDTSTINLCDGRSYIKSTVLVTANGATDITFGTYNDVAIAERMRITSAGLVGIGTTSPSVILHALGKIRSQDSRGGSFAAVEIYGGDSNFNPYISVDQNNPLTFITGATERMRITSAGKVNINNTANTTYQLYVDGGSTEGAVITTTSAANQLKLAGTAPALTITNTVSSPTIGGSLGACTSASQFLSGTAAGDMILINQFTGNKLYITNYSGGVYLTQGATSWTANSDIRIKDINSHITNAVEKLSTLQTINFCYKDDIGKKENLGLIAQEVEMVFPELIETNNDGILGVRYTELIPVLIKAIQELKAEINQLKNK